MQKVYLLLRSNKQSGPYTIDELLDLNLKPLDLVWVEGKSFGWSYPSEIESLKAFVEAPVEDKFQIRRQPSQQPPANNNSSFGDSYNKIFVSLPSNGSDTFNLPSKTTNNSLPHIDQVFNSSEEPEIDHNALERKADELRKRAQTYASARPTLKKEDEVEIKYAKSLAEVEEDYTSWVYQNKRKKKNYIPKEYLLSVLAVIVVIAGGWFIGSHLFNRKAQISEQIVHVKNAEREEIEPVFTEIPEEENFRFDIVTNENQVNKTIVSKPIAEEKQMPAKPAIKEIEKPDVAFEPTPESYEKPILQTTEEPVAEVEQPKKKTLGESVNEVFRKLTKNVEGETKRESPNSERKSNRKGEMSTSEIDISDQVEVKMHNNSDNWMMGVIGLKLTLNNKSSIPLKAAEIEILYYNDQEKLLDKKKITFSNIAPKKSQTISAPDHRLADHAEFKIISAIGIQDAFAKN
jgi:hypothetical protein